MHAARRGALQLETDLRRAIERERAPRPLPADRLAATRTAWSGFEALRALAAPASAACVSPGEFIPLAEETGLILPHRPLGARARRAASWREWQGAAPARRRLRDHVNLSRKQFSQPDLVERVAGACWRDTGLRPAAPAAGDHRERDHGGRRGAGRAAGALRELGRPALPRRLRHRLLVAGLPAPLPDRQPEDRPLLRGPAGEGGRGPRPARPHHHDARGEHAHGRGRRGRGDPRAAGRSCATCAASASRATSSRARCPRRTPSSSSPRSRPGPTGSTEAPGRMLLGP